MTLMGLDNYVKLAVAVDSDVDVFDEQEVLWALATRFQADRDLFVVPSVLCNRLDPSSVDGMSAKMGLDATKPMTWTLTELQFLKAQPPGRAASCLAPKSEDVVLVGA